VFSDLSSDGIVAVTVVVAVVVASSLACTPRREDPEMLMLIFVAAFLKPLAFPWVVVAAEPAP